MDARIAGDALMSRHGRLRFAPSHREKLRAANASNSFYASMAGEKLAPELTNDIAPKRAYTKREDDDKEALVIEAVSELLSAMPEVMWAVRQNSGVAGETFVRFYRILKAPSSVHDVTITDFWGFLRDGKPFALECKRPSWKWANTEREQKQQRFLDVIGRLGGPSAFVTSAAQAEAILRR